MQTGHTMWQRRCHVFCLLPCPVRITHHVILCPLFPGPSGVMQHQLDQLLILLHDRSCGETSYSLSPLSELLRVHSQDIPNRNTLGSLLKTPKRIRGAPLTKWEHQNSWRLRAKGNTIRLVSQQGLPVWNLFWNLFWPLCRNRHCRTKHTHSQSHRGQLACTSCWQLSTTHIGESKGGSLCFLVSFRSTWTSRSNLKRNIKKQSGICWRDHGK